MDIRTQPIEDGHDDADVAEKIAGLLEQTRQDLAQNHVDDVDDVLRQRLADAKIEVTDDEFEKLAAQLR